MGKFLGIAAFILMTGGLNALAASPMEGDWSGAGTMMGDDRRVTDCGQVSIRVRRTETELEFPDGLDNCQIISDFIEPARFEIREGSLLLNGKTVGDISDTKVHIEVTDTKEGFHELLELELYGGGLAYRDTISLLEGDGSGNNSVTIKSVLHQKQ